MGKSICSTHEHTLLVGLLEWSLLCMSAGGRITLGKDLLLSGVVPWDFVYSGQFRSIRDVPGFILSAQNEQTASQVGVNMATPFILGPSLHSMTMENEHGPE